MVGIICALAIEVEGIQSIMQNKTEVVYSKLKFVSGTVDGKDIVAVECGIGKVNAAMCAQVMIDRYAPDIIINSGIAGALSSVVSIGDIVVSKDCVQHDMDGTATGDPKGEIWFSDEKRIDFPADEVIAEKLYKACLSIPDTKVVMGRIASGDIFVADRNLRQSIGEQFNAVACEMEGGAIAHVCYRNDVPFAILRSISDDLDENLFMDFVKFRDLAAEKSITAIKNFLKLV